MVSFSCERISMFVPETALSRFSLICSKEPEMLSVVSFTFSFIVFSCCLIVTSLSSLSALSIGSWKSFMLPWLISAISSFRVIIFCV